MYDNNAVTLFDCRHSVSNHDACAAFHRAVKSLLHDFLALLVQSRRGLVKDHDLRRLDERSRNRNSLLLAARQFAALETAQFHEARIELIFEDLQLFLVDKLHKPTVESTFDPLALLLQKHTEVLVRVVER